MDISIVFRIAAVGVLVAVLNQVLLRAGRGTGYAYDVGRIGGCAFLGDSVCQHTF